jgi:hypothetical protein
MSKRIIITPEQLTELGLLGPEFYLRFRIISEDRNRLSPWTPIFTISS